MTNPEGLGVQLRPLFLRAQALARGADALARDLPLSDQLVFIVDSTEIHEYLSLPHSVSSVGSASGSDEQERLLTRILVMTGFKGKMVLLPAHYAELRARIVHQLTEGRELSALPQTQRADRRQDALLRLRAFVDQLAHADAQESLESDAQERIRSVAEAVLRPLSQAESALVMSTRLLRLVKTTRLIGVPAAELARLKGQEYEATLLAAREALNATHYEAYLRNRRARDNDAVALAMATEMARQSPDLHVRVYSNSSAMRMALGSLKHKAISRTIVRPRDQKYWALGFGAARLEGGRLEMSLGRLAPRTVKRMGESAREYLRLCTRAISTPNAFEHATLTNRLIDCEWRLRTDLGLGLTISEHDAVLAAASMEHLRAGQLGDEVHQTLRRLQVITADRDQAQGNGPDARLSRASTAVAHLREYLDRELPLAIETIERVASDHVAASESALNELDQQFLADEAHVLTRPIKYSVDRMRDDLALGSPKDAKRIRAYLLERPNRSADELCYLAMALALLDEFPLADQMLAKARTAIDSHSVVLADAFLLGRRGEHTRAVQLLKGDLGSQGAFYFFVGGRIHLDAWWHSGTGYDSRDAALLESAVRMLSRARDSQDGFCGVWVKHLAQAMVLAAEAFVGSASSALDRLGLSQQLLDEIRSSGAPVTVEGEARFSIAMYWYLLGKPANARSDLRTAHRLCPWVTRYAEASDVPPLGPLPGRGAKD